MILDMIFDVFLGMIVALVITPVFCVIVTPYIFVKAFFEKDKYWNNVAALYKKHIIDWMKSMLQK